jgi:hypothetical protein
MLTTVPVRKPGKQEYVRVHPSPEYRCNYAIIEVKSTREVFVVPPPLAKELADELTIVTLHTAITSGGDVLLWPIPLPQDGRDNDYWISARDAANRAVDDWTRIKANQAVGAYDIYKALGALADPEWPKLTLDQLVEIAFKGRVIDNLDHLVVKQLRGLA